MFVHVKYGNECGDRIVEFNNNNQFITVNDVIEKLRQCSTPLLLYEHGRELNLQEIVKNARVYIVRRRSS